MPHGDAPRNTLEVLAEEFAARIRSGENPRIEEYAANHPQLESEMRELFPTIEALERLRHDKASESGSSSRLKMPRIERLGDLRIAREIGRGGMGVVYEAIQESLGRRVAVKVLPKQTLLDSKQLLRFEREAKTAAKLHHTNIVPVLGVGQHDGYHYYVMQYIDGIGVDEVVTRLRYGGEPATSMRLSSCYNASQSDSHADTVSLSQDEPTDADLRAVETASATVSIAEDPVEAGRQHPGTLSRAGNYWTDVATIGHQVACALHYAHQQGTLHRDVKPGNLILDSHGTTWVADFGLAKAGEQDGVTRSGDIVGTLKYMAPEQLKGEADARSDVYGLGLTLYELLTLRSAHQDRNRKQSLVQGTAGFAITPPRAICGAIPADLETIVLTSIAEHPGQRYQTAGELAADLQRFLEQRPIAARRISPLGRLLRWGRRNPAVASLSAIAASLLILVAAVASIGYWRTDQALRSESTQRQRAEATLAVSLNALDTIYRRYVPQASLEPVELELGDDAADVELPAAPVLTREAADLLENMLDFYDRLAELNTEDETLRLDAAMANRRVGYIHERLGKYEEAKAAFERAIERYQALARNAPQPQLYQLEVIRIRNQLSEVLRRMSSPREAEQECKLAMAELEQLMKQSPTPEVRYELAHTHYLLGRSSRGGPRFRDREGRGRRSRGATGPPPPERSDGEPPGPPRGPASRATAGGGHPADRPPPPAGRPERRGPSHRSDRDERSEHLNTAIAILTEIGASSPNVPEYRRLLALCYRERRNRETSAEDARQAVEILGELVDQYPAIEEYRYDLCETYTKVNMRRWAHGDYEPAISQLESAYEIATSLNWNVPAYRLSAMRIQIFRGMLYRRMLGESVGESLANNELAATYLDRAIECFESGIEIQEGLPHGVGDSSAYSLWRVTGLHVPLAQLLVGRGTAVDIERARALVIEARDLMDQADPKWNEFKHFRRRRQEADELWNRLQSVQVTSPLRTGTVPDVAREPIDE